ncbi:hypothetical protein ABK040_009926 [Willaertia magna]
MSSNQSNPRKKQKISNNDDNNTSADDDDGNHFSHQEIINKNDSNKNKIGKKLQKYVHLFYEITTFFKDLKLFKIFRFVCKQWNEWILTHELFTFKYKLNHSTNLTNKSLALYFFKWNLFRQKYIYIKVKVLQNNLQNTLQNDEEENDTSEEEENQHEKDQNIINNDNMTLTDKQLLYPEINEESFTFFNNEEKKKYKEYYKRKKRSQKKKITKI